MLGLILGMLLVSLGALAQAPMDIPSQMEVAGIKLKIRSDAQKEIQETYDLLTRSPKHFEALVERTRMYMPYIEQILKQEGLPDDLKFLPIQESQLISDAVSSSNAVGFWQFKKATAQELGLRVDGVVDERKHIILATVGATRYFKRSNFTFDNWILSLQSYLQGLTGTQRSVSEDLYGAKSMVINGKSHWYVKKFLAHYLAFQDHVGGSKVNKNISLLSYEGRGKTLRQVSNSTGVDDDVLRKYNKWLNQSRIPDDKSYMVFYPSQSGKQPIVQRTPDAKKENKSKTEETKASSSGNKQNTKTVKNSLRFRAIENNIGAFPQITGNVNKPFEPGQIELNGIPAIKAKANDNLQTLSNRTGVSEDRLQKFNDIGERGNIRQGKFYYLERKKNKGKVHYHIVQPGETLWGISQDYGIKLKKLIRKNRMREVEELKVGRVLWMRFIRPQKIPIEYSELSVPVGNKKLPIPEKPATKASNLPSLNKRPKVEELPLRESQIRIPVWEQHQPKENEKIIVHKVKPMETLFALSAQYQVEIDDILVWNNRTVLDTMRVGEEFIIIVPKRNSKPEKIIEHTVTTGETFWSIARKYGVSVNELKDWNNRTNDTLSLGEKLKVKSSN